MTIEDAVNGVFSRLTAGELAERVLVQSGWEVDLPSGKTVARSTLQAEARALIALGPSAVPHLLPWVMNDNPALRYVAVYALEQITGEKPYVLHFDQADAEGNRTRAIEVWRRWYEANKKRVGATVD
jgi:hypothetical protein